MQHRHGSWTAVKEGGSPHLNFSPCMAVVRMVVSKRKFDPGLTSSSLCSSSLRYCSSGVRGTVARLRILRLQLLFGEMGAGCAAGGCSVQ